MSTDSRLPFRAPPAASAAADILLAAFQRSFALHASLIEDMVDRGVGMRRDPTGAGSGPMSVSAWLRPPVEPMLRWATGLVSVGQSTTASLAALAFAQLRGAREDVDALQRDARHDAETAGAALSDAIRPVAAAGLGAVVRLADFAASAGRAATERTGTIIDVSADVADAAASEQDVDPEATGAARDGNARADSGDEDDRNGGDRRSGTRGGPRRNASARASAARGASSARSASARKASRPPPSRGTSSRSAAPGASAGAPSAGRGRARPAAAERPAARAGVSRSSRRTPSPPRATSSSRRR